MVVLRQGNSALERGVEMTEEKEIAVGLRGIVLGMIFLGILSLFFGYLVGVSIYTGCV